MPFTDSSHLVIPFAACSGDAWLQAMQALPAGSLKNLGKLLQGMQLASTSQGEAFSLSTPHERVLAQAQGLAGTASLDGLLPWAAVEAATRPGASGKAWAHITLCHWAMGREHATLSDPAALDLTPSESSTLLAAMQPYFETEGITLHGAAPPLWLAEGELFRHLPTASLDRVLGRNVDPWLPGAASAGSLRRLQNEMQMLLYTHPLNDARIAKRQLPVNSFWISGSGALEQPAQPEPNPASNVSVSRALASPAFTNDWSAYAQAWQALDADEIAQLLQQQNAGQTVQLSLCGERNAQTFASAKVGLFSRISNIFASQPPLAVLVQL